MSPMHNRAGSQRGLMMTMTALEYPVPAFQIREFFTAAFRTDIPFRPTYFKQIFPASSFVGKFISELLETHFLCVCHSLCLRSSPMSYDTSLAKPMSYIVVYCLKPIS